MTANKMGLRMQAATVLAGLVFVAAACASAADEGDDELVVYERVWPDSITETTTIYKDGRVSMLHGEFLERFTLEDSDIQLLRGGLEEPLIAVSEPGSPQRTVTRADGTVVQVGPPESDSFVDLLDRLTDTHRLEAPGEAGSDEQVGAATPDSTAGHEHEPSVSPDHEGRDDHEDGDEHEEG